ncbi:non-heme iron oxygenase ferredoxin subunit [Nocardioides limicola]|uniref:non-heme iron oxygenase ferredoxin subunit n=1 Tax=Nocardioides limicola TaxID=2803368 RepID=UPI00193BE2B9|nr:non-heme iron oxygenase ferredoxin subunit [Nocardioides sp. DJM-14]
MSFTRACATDDVPVDEGLAVTVGEYEIVVARCGDDFYALQNLCSHAAVELSEGEVSGCAIECWLHGSTFDLRTGKPTTFPATEPVATFAVEVRDAAVYVDTTTTLNGVTPT